MKSKKLLKKWIYCLIPALIGGVMYFVLPHFPKFTEYAITRGLFRVIAFPYEWIMSVFPFSITEIVVVLSVPACVTLIIVWAIKLIRKENIYIYMIIYFSLFCNTFFVFLTDFCLSFRRALKKHLTPLSLC